MSPRGNIRGQARPLLDGLVSRGYSTTRIQELLQSSGLGYRRTDLLSDIAQIRGIEQKSRTFSSIPRNRLPTLRTIATTSKHLSTPFMYTAKVWYKDPVTGDRSFRWRSMTLGAARTRGALQNRLIDLASKDAEQYGVVTDGVTNESLTMRETADFAWEPDDSDW